MKPENKIKWF